MSDHESHHHGKNEIIIIKRHSPDHDGAHGGAWKIAYADFMTAMMAFFLIMWLVNAANEETKAAVASYFNPIKLTDSKPAQRGLKKPAEDAEGEASQEKSEEKSEEKTKGDSADQGKDKSSQAGEKTQYSEADYFENPYAVLAEIAKDTAMQANVSIKGEGGANEAGPATGAEGGEAYRDPFDPDFWTQQVEVSSTTIVDPNARPIEGAGLPDDGTAEVTTGQKSDGTGNEKEGDRKPGTQADGDMKAGDGFTDQNGMTDHVGNADTDSREPAEGKDGKTDKALAGKTDKAELGKTDMKENGESREKGTANAGKLAKSEAAAKTLEAELRVSLAKASGDLAKGLTVTATEDGLLVSITDQVKLPMFDVGSSVPRRETVLAMARIAQALKGRPGEIVIRGHTDGRQYKKGEYDNWRLSTARAQSAYFMLLKGGLDEARIGEVSGLADRQLKVPGKPLDDQNRRIEILVKSDQG